MDDEFTLFLKAKAVGKKTVSEETTISAYVLIVCI